jgi:cell wall-associated NlpC family hydrolase
MRFAAITVEVLTICGFALGASYATAQVEPAPKPEAVSQVRRESGSQRLAVLNKDDGLSLIAAALDAHTHTARQSDCSHLVHAIYLQAGFPYAYASSSDLYDGTEDFRKVKHPQPGDLVVWPGHVGIVVNPAKHLFFSRLSSGPGVDAYDAQYWKDRGQARFFRYVKSSSSHAAETRRVSSQRHK